MNVRRLICGSVATVFNDAYVRRNKEEEGGGTESVPRKFTDEREIMGSGGGSARSKSDRPSPASVSQQALESNKLAKL